MTEHDESTYPHSADHSADHGGADGGARDGERRERGPHGELHPERDTEFGRLTMTDSGITLNLGGGNGAAPGAAPSSAQVGSADSVASADGGSDADAEKLERLADLVGVRVGELAGDEEASISDGPFDAAALERLNAELDARAGATDPNPSLDRVAALLDLLGSPERTFKVIQVAGTNGKTSTARMTASLLRALGHRVGLFTSPELVRVTEPIELDGTEIAPERLAEMYDELAPFLRIVDGQFPTPLSRFEVLVALAYMAFADAPVDVAVVEVGMGGTWDATNVVDADVAVLTPVGLDHQRFLGETLAEIAAQKAGILKPREADGLGPAENIAVVAEQEPDAMRAILERAVETEAIVARAGSEFTVGASTVAVGGQQLTLRGLGGEYDEVFLPLAGAHQAANASLALAAVEAFFGVDREHPLDIDAVRAGFAKVSVPGRIERFGTEPVVLIDAAHNPHGARTLAAALQRDFNYAGMVGVVSVFADKDARAMLRALEPHLREVIITTNSSPRAMDAYDLAEVAYEIFGDDRVRVEEHLPAAVELAREVAEDADEDGMGVLVTGSVVTAGDARAYLAAAHTDGGAADAEA